METKLFRMVSVEERLPNGVFEGMFIDQFGTWSKNRYDFDSTFEKESCLRTNNFWLEEFELPSEEEIKKESDKGWVRSHFQAGASFIINKILNK